VHPAVSQAGFSRARQEIRAYLRDPDGHLIEVGEVTGLLG